MQDRRMNREFAFRCGRLHGCGNSFVLLFVPSGALADWPELARRICDPASGVGADGLLVIRSWTDGHWPVEMWNPDGSPMGMCGNGIRCVTRFLYDEELVQGSGPVRFTVGERVITCWLLSGGNVRVDMGVPSFQPADIPLASPEPLVHQPVSLLGRSFLLSAVSMGNPHCVLFEQGGESWSVSEWGPLLERHPLFPERANVSFAAVQSPGCVSLRVWERGAGATQACGTAACATVVVGHQIGLLARRVEVLLPGGALDVELNEDGRVLLSGPTERLNVGYVPYSWLRGAEEARWSVLR